MDGHDKRPATGVAGLQRGGFSSPVLWTWLSRPRGTYSTTNHAAAEGTPIRRSRGGSAKAGPYGAIAGELGYANRGSVYAVVRKAMDTHEASDVERLGELEVAAHAGSREAVRWGRG